jgi:hypothetical protein
VAQFGYEEVRLFERRELAALGMSSFQASLAGVVSEAV